MNCLLLPLLIAVNYFEAMSYDHQQSLNIYQAHVVPILVSSLMNLDKHSLKVLDLIISYLQQPHGFSKYYTNLATICGYILANIYNQNITLTLSRKSRPFFNPRLNVWVTPFRTPFAIVFYS